MKKRVWKMGKTLPVLLALLLVFTGCGIKLAKEKTFSKAGMSITLTDQFAEKDIVTYTATYQSNRYLVFALKEEFSLFEDAGLSADMSLEEYADLIAYNNGIEMELKEQQGVTYFEYEKTANGKELSYFAVIARGADAYWLIQFACEEEDYAKSQELFLKWAKTIQV